MIPIYIENCILLLKQVVLIGRVVLISSGLYHKHDPSLLEEILN